MKLMTLSDDTGYIDGADWWHRWGLVMTLSDDIDDDGNDSDDSDDGDDGDDA